MTDEDVTVDNFTIEEMGPEAPFVFSQAQVGHEQFSHIVRHKESAYQLIMANRPVRMNPDACLTRSRAGSSSEGTTCIKQDLVGRTSASFPTEQKLKVQSPFFFADTIGLYNMITFD